MRSDVSGTLLFLFVNKAMRCNANGKQCAQAYIVQHALEVALCGDKGRDCAVIAAEAHIGTSCIADEG